MLIVVVSRRGRGSLGVSLILGLAGGSFLLWALGRALHSRITVLGGLGTLKVGLETLDEILNDRQLPHHLASDTLGLHAAVPGRHNHLVKQLPCRCLQVLPRHLVLCLIFYSRHLLLHHLGS